MKTRMSTDERRVFNRAALQASINWTSESNFYTGFTNDISEGGIFVATHTLQEINSTMELEFSIPDGQDPIKAIGIVRWIREYNPDSDAEPGMGLQFTNLTDQDKGRIQAFVNRRETIFFED